MPDTDPYPEAARTFIDAYANTNYLRPLKGKEMERFYVNRGFHSELRALMGELEAGARTFPPSNTKFLFVGHTGCGKSTELSRLASLIESGTGRHEFLANNFLPIQYSARWSGYIILNLWTLPSPSSLVFTKRWSGAAMWLMNLPPAGFMTGFTAPDPAQPPILPALLILTLMLILIWGWGA